MMRTQRFSTFAFSACMALLGALMLPVVGTAQEIGMTGGDYTGCDFFFVDAGMTSSDYPPNSNVTMTFCPEGADPIINFYFNLFSLGQGDQLSVWLGDEAVGAPYGVYSGFDLQGEDLYSQMDGANNPGGCITFLFESDGTENGNWTAEVSCEYPCVRPFAIIETDEETPLMICVGEEVTFHGGNSEVADGAEILEWYWDFDDGNEGAMTPEVTHSFSEPGAYKVQLFLTDNLDCENNNLTDHLVLVSTPPDFTATTPDLTICGGQTYSIDGVADPITYDDTPGANFGGALFIPDDQTQCFESSIFFDVFSPGQTVTSPSDFVDVFINFEHSYMGDLTITIICPDGSSMGLHQQGGGSTFLGVPVDNDATPNAEGIGWDYTWDPGATNGTWADNLGGTLPSGAYEAAQPWDLLTGCPMNGNWTIEVCDSWGSDNGFIFDWAVNFDPELYPEPIVFTPVIGSGCDSTYWTGPFITNNGSDEDCNGIEITPTDFGTATYLFTAVNNFGCSFSDTVEVTVVPGPSVDAEWPVAWCGSPIDLSAWVVAPEPGFNYEWEWSTTVAGVDLVPGSTSGANTNATIDELSSPTWVVATVDMIGGELDACLASDSAEVQLLSPPLSGQTLEYDLCVGSELALFSPGQSQDWTYTYEWTWTHENNLGVEVTEVVSVLNAIGVTEEGDYQVTVTMDAPCIWDASTSYIVDLEECVILIPNIFTPNNLGDGNDNFVIQGVDAYPGSTLHVFNRWGSIVYESTSYTNGWRPTEEEAPDGTYYFVLGVNRNDGSADREMHSGYVEIMRNRR
jgi:gliding motility-associated-like protein